MIEWVLVVFCHRRGRDGRGGRHHTSVAIILAPLSVDRYCESLCVCVRECPLFCHCYACLFTNERFLFMYLNEGKVVTARSR